MFHRMKWLFKKSFTPITIMVVPHANLRSINLKIPAIGVLTSILFSMVGTWYVFSVAVKGLEYESMSRKLDYYSNQFSQWNATVSALKQAEGDFRRLFSLNSKENVLENVDTSFSGAVDLKNLMLELLKTVESVDEIKDYLRTQKDIYMATPKGYPVAGNITSRFGKRLSPFNGENVFHSGIDIASSPGAPVRTTADGVVSYSGWTTNSGNVIVIEHGCGFSTIYAHNKKNGVKVGQRVKRGEVVGYVGSTGKSTGPHVHYEVWKNGRHMNPQKFLQGRS